MEDNQNANSSYDTQFEKNSWERRKEDENTTLNPEAEEWQKVMADMEPGIASAEEWERVMGDIDEEGGLEQDTTDGYLEKASKLSGYGLDVACREYGLDTVLNAIVSIDERASDSTHPISSIYARIAPKNINRQKLFYEINKDKDYQDKSKEIEKTLEEQQQAVSSMKKVINILETNPKFEDLRDAAAATGKNIPSFLTEGKIKPTLTDFFDKINENGDFEIIAEEIAKEVENDSNEQLTTNDESEQKSEAN